MTIYLYVKTHNKTGLKYLGKTEQDPNSYQGSGVYWTDHIKIHGYDVTTEVIRECSTTEELRELGIHYSNLWNIVESDEWANLKEECGDGLSSEDAKRMWENPEHQKIVSNFTTQQWQDPEFIEMQNNARKSPEYVANQRTKALKRWEDENLRRMQSERTTGAKHPKYDHTIYHFVHKNGTSVHCTKYELYTKYSLDSSKIYAVTRGLRRSHSGWRIIHQP